MKAGLSLLEISVVIQEGFRGRVNPDTLTLANLKPIYKKAVRTLRMLRGDPVDEQDLFDEEAGIVD